MSLLEDVFLQDEAGEAQELERVIEGDEYDESERPRSRSPDSDNNSEKSDEAAEERQRVDPAAKAKKVVKNPRFVLNPARLTGPRGIQIIPEHFKDFKFKGKGHEKEDLDLVLKKLEHWAYRLYPKFQFEDCLKKIETLGKKRPVMVHLHKIRSDQFLSDETVVQKDSSDEETPQAAPPEEDEFDKLLQQQIELARATPAPGSVKKGFGTPSVLDKRSPLMMPKATSSPSISDEQRERMLKQRQLAEERRLARLKQKTLAEITDNDSVSESQTLNGDVIDITAETDRNIQKVTSDNDTVIDMTDNNFGNNVTGKINGVVIDIADISNKPINKIPNNTVIDITGVNNTEEADVDMVDKVKSKKKHNRSVIESDSSDEECGVTSINQSITVQMHVGKDNNSCIEQDKKDTDKNKNGSEVDTIDLFQGTKIDNNQDIVIIENSNDNEKRNANVARVDEEIVDENRKSGPIDVDRSNMFELSYNLEENTTAYDLEMPEIDIGCENTADLQADEIRAHNPKESDIKVTNIEEDKLPNDDIIMKEKDNVCDQIEIIDKDTVKSVSDGYSKDKVSEEIMDLDFGDDF